MSSAHTFEPLGQNRILHLLPHDDAARVMAQTEQVTLERDFVFARPGRPITRVYFPLTLVGSHLAAADDGDVLEVGTVGNEGVVGIPVFLGADTVPDEYVCQIPGDALVMRAENFRAEIDRSPALRKVLGRYTQSYMSLVAQTAVCNGVHSVEERTARWLLMTHDRVGSDVFSLTQEYLAMMLNVRRAGVSVVAGTIQRAGFITYHRGTITILDREGLESASCDCYQIVRNEFDRLLGG